MGGGHGLYLRAFCSEANSNAKVDVVDISPTSLRLCQEMAAAPNAEFILGDVHDFSRAQYDFITMGEVLEHVEDPIKLLRKLRTLCCPGGSIFVTTPTNAPAIDHIYLFETVQDIRDVIGQAGLEILNEIQVETERIKNGKAANVKIATLYGALLTPCQT